MPEKTTDKPRRVEFHKDDWAKKCERQRIEIEALKNQIEHLKWQLECASLRRKFRKAARWLADRMQTRRTV